MATEPAPDADRVIQTISYALQQIGIDQIAAAEELLFDRIFEAFREIGSMSVGVLAGMILSMSTSILAGQFGDMPPELWVGYHDGISQLFSSMLEDIHTSIRRDRVEDQNVGAGPDLPADIEEFVSHLWKQTEKED